MIQFTVATPNTFAISPFSCFRDNLKWTLRRPAEKLNKIMGRIQWFGA